MTLKGSVSFDAFTPCLRRGRLIPQGKMFIYETFEPFNQIVLPIEMADLIALSSGRYNMREIIEKIYQRQGHVHFRSVFEAVHRLQQGGFFENGNDLSAPDPSSLPQLEASFWESLALQIPLIRRISNDFKSPWSFYLISLFAVIFGLLSLLYIPRGIDPIALAFSETSFVWGLVYAWLCFSIMISFKNILKAVFLLLLTGKSYNFSIQIKPWAIHFHVGNESQFLIQNKIFLMLYHLSLFLSPLILISGVHWFVSSEVTSRLFVMASIYMIWQLNPFNPSQLTQFFRNFFDLEGRVQASSYFRSDSILHLLDPLQESPSERAKVLFRWIHLSWPFLAVLVFSWILYPHMSFQKYLSVKSSANEYVAGSLILLALLGGWHYALYQGIKTFYFTFFARPLQSLLRIVKKVAQLRIVEFSEQEIFESIQDLPIFNNLNDEFIHKIIQSSELLDVKKGEFLLREDQISDAFYVLLSGRIEISRLTPSGRKWLGNIHPVSIFGESAILDNEARQADAICLERSRVFRVPARVIREIAHENRYIRDLEAFKDAIVVNQFFHSAPMFRDLPREVVDMLIHRGKIEYYSSEELVFEQGSVGTSFYMILRGSVEVVINDTPIKKIRQGGFFGEIAVIASIPRTASIRTSEPSVLLSIKVDAFWEILVQHIELALFIESVGEQRFKEGVQLFHSETVKTDAA